MLFPGNEAPVVGSTEVAGEIARTDAVSSGVVRLLSRSRDAAPLVCIYLQQFDQSRAVRIDYTAEQSNPS